MALPGSGFDGEGPPADDYEHDRRAGRDDGLEELLLAAVEAERRAVAELTGRRVVGQAGPLTDDEDRDLGRARDLDGRGDLLVAAVGDPGATGVADLGADERGADRIEDRPRPASSSPGSITSASPTIPSAFPPSRISRRVCMWTRWL